MTTIKMNANNESEMKWMIKGLESSGYIKIADCMWAKIYAKGNTHYVINRNY